ncbi:MAG: hypothetical protein NVS4B12_01640 [Ktedonobacteraceae bacterium]
MRRYVLIGIAALFYYSGLVQLARWWTQRSQQYLIILNYHCASKGNLRQHFFYLKKYYRIMHIESALEELYASSNVEVQRSKRPPSLAITFDDGYRDNYTYAYPLAQKLEIPFTIYLIPGYIESGDYFWWGESQRLVSRMQASSATIENHSYNLERPDERTLLATTIDKRIRYAQSVAERETFLASTRATLSIPPTTLEEDEPSLPLTWEQVKEMDESGWVSFGAHTMHHPILSYLTDYAEMQREIEECRTVLESQLGHLVCSFAYPVGQMQHVGDDVRNMVRKVGYKWGVTTSYGFNTAKSDPYLLRRIEVDVDQHWLVVAAEAAGLWGFFSRLRWLPLVRKYFTNSKQ